MTTWAEINAKKYSELAFSMIQAAELDVNDFAEELYLPSLRIVYRPTRDYFAFGGENGGAMWTRPGRPGKTSQTGRGNPESWEAKIRNFAGWLGELQEFLTAIEEHEQTAPPAPDSAESSTATRHAAGDRAGTARNEIRLPSELGKPMGQLATGTDRHWDLLKMILKRKPTTVEKWASGHKLGRTTVFDWMSCLSSGKSFKRKVSKEKSAEIKKAIEDDAKATQTVSSTGQVVSGFGRINTSAVLAAGAPQPRNGTAVLRLTF